MHVASINVTRNAHVHIGQSNLRKPIYDNDSHDNDNDKLIINTISYTPSDTMQYATRTVYMTKQSA